MKHRLALVIALFCLNTAVLSAADCDTVDVRSDGGRFRFEGYSGGMLLHTGYVQSRKFSMLSPDGSALTDMVLRGAPVGIGGALRINFGAHLRIGTEGYVSTLYGRNGSYQKVGRGGVLADCAWERGRWTLFAGATFGGGGVTNLVSSSSDHDDYLVEDGSVLYRKYAFMLLSPFFGAEYAITSKVHLMLKADYLCNLTNWEDDYVSGPRIYFGFMFCH